MGIFTECARCDQLKAEVKRLEKENGQWQRACAKYTGVIAAQDKRIIELLEALEKLRIDLRDTEGDVAFWRDEAKNLGD